jgi:hypothetical protein
MVIPSADTCRNEESSKFYARSFFPLLFIINSMAYETAGTPEVLRAGHAPIN